MASSIDKTSVREQFDSIKNDFNTLSSSGKMSGEAALLMKSLITLFEIVLAIFMEKNTKKTNHNSGIPSSQSDPDNSSTGSKGKTNKRRKTQDKGFETSLFSLPKRLK